MARPSVQALFRHVFGSVKGYLSGKPLSHRRRIGLRKIHLRGEGNRILSDVVSRMKPQLVSRLGTTENSLVQYFVEHQADGECVFPDHLKTAITELSGFFPAEDLLLSEFSRQRHRQLQFPSQTENSSSRVSSSPSPLGRIEPKQLIQQQLHFVSRQPGIYC